MARARLPKHVSRFAYVLGKSLLRIAQGRAESEVYVCPTPGILAREHQLCFSGMFVTAPSRVTVLAFKDAFTGGCGTIFIMTFYYILR